MRGNNSIENYDVLESLQLTPAAFHSKVVVVTGGGRGIGREILNTFARLGAQVIIAEISEEGHAAVEEVKKAGGKALYVQTDISDEIHVKRLAHKAEELAGPVDILINNAILCPVADVTEMETELWDRVMSVNLRGTFLTCKYFLPGMLKRGKGIIVNMVSTEAMPGLSAYIAAKQGITGFSQSLAAETTGSGVHVLAFAPGMVDTPGIRQAARELAPKLGLTIEQFFKISLHPAYEGLMPADHAAAAAAFLAANLAEEYHGEVVDGYSVLEQAGLISRQGLPEKKPEDTVPFLPESAHLKGQEVLKRVQRLLGELQETILLTGKEFEQLPVFIRPMARRGFTKKTGQSLQDWQRSVQRVKESIMEILGDRPEVLETVILELPELKELLMRLSVYYQEVPGETARFTRDAEVIEELTQKMEKRVALIQELAGLLERLTHLHHD